VDGRDIFLLLDMQGANMFFGWAMGHSAALIGRDFDEETGDHGWYLYSKNGGASGAFGKADFQKGIYFKTFGEFVSDKEKDQIRYDKALRFQTTPTEDEKMKEAVEKQVQSFYTVWDNSCNRTFCGAGDKLNSSSREVIFFPGTSPIPNISYKQTKLWNQNSSRYLGEYDLNSIRQSMSK